MVNGGCHTEILEVLRGGFLNDVSVLMRFSRPLIAAGATTFLLIEK